MEDGRRIADGIRKRFEARGVCRYGVLVLEAGVALEMIEECRVGKVPILGVDGFYLMPDAIRSDMTNSIDISLMGDVDSWAVATDFVGRRAGGELTFEVVI